MSTDKNDTGEAVVAFVSGILIGAAASLLFVRMKNQRKPGFDTDYDDYSYEGGDLFV